MSYILIINFVFVIIKILREKINNKMVRREIFIFVIFNNMLYIKLKLEKLYEY